MWESAHSRRKKYIWEEKKAQDGSHDGLSRVTLHTQWSIWTWRTQCEWRPHCGAAWPCVSKPKQSDEACTWQWAKAWYAESQSAKHITEHLRAVLWGVVDMKMGLSTLGFKTVDWALKSNFRMKSLLLWLWYKNHPMMLMTVFSIGFYEVPHFIVSQLRKCQWESKGCSWNSCSGLLGFLRNTDQHFPPAESRTSSSGLGMFKNSECPTDFLLSALPGQWDTQIDTVASVYLTRYIRILF